MKNVVFLCVLSLWWLCSCGVHPAGHDLVQTYSQAQSARDADDPLSATLRFHEVLRLSRKSHDKRFEGYACQQLSLLYAQNYDHDGAVAFARRAVAALEEAQDTAGANFSRIDLARQYFAMNRKERAEELADSLLPFLREPELLYYLYVLKADLCNARKDYAGAQRYYRDIFSLGFSSSLDVVSQCALVEEHLGNHERADSLLSYSFSLVESGIDSIKYYSASHEIHALRGDYRSAWQEVAFASEMQGKAVSAVLLQSVTHAMQAYFEEQYQMERVRRQRAYFLFLLAVLCLMAVIFLSVLTIRRNRQKVLVEMERADALLQDLQEAEMHRQGIDAAISTLVQDKIKSMQRLTETYFSWSDRAITLREEQEGKALREEIIVTFRSELRLLRSDESLIPSIERALNIYNDNLMAHLREDFSGLSGGTKLKDKDYQLLCLFFSGFSTKSIGFMMDMSDEAVRGRKFRYRQLFASLSGPRMNEYYQRLSKTKK